jgi:hypothetical protein
MPRAQTTADETEELAPPPRRRGRPPGAPTIGKRGRKETHSTDFKMGQYAPITDATPREDVSRAKSNGHRLFGGRLKQTGDILYLDRLEVTEEYLTELAFYEEPLTIIINPSAHKNAATIFENWCGGIKAEMWIANRWVQVGNLPVGKPITVKRHIVEHIIRARVITVQTLHDDATVASPRNEIHRSPSHVHSFSVLKDDSPRSQEWLEYAYKLAI